MSKAFYDGSDELQVFALNQKAFTANKSVKSLSKYYGELIEIFQELDHRVKMVMKDIADVEAYKKFIKRLMVHILLTGLDGDFEKACGEAVSHATLKGDVGDSNIAATVPRNWPKITKAIEKAAYKCTYCDQLGHTKDHCYELVGYLEWWDHSRAL